ncbi:MAG: DUF222 domain-containing protein [Acidimicrobiales bacterium]
MPAVSGLGDTDTAERAERVEGLLGCCEQLRRELAGWEHVLVVEADGLAARGGPGVQPEDVLARRGVSGSEAGRRVNRHRATEGLAATSGAVRSGRANPECLDRLAAARKDLEGSVELAAFAAHDEEIADWVVEFSPRVFARRVNDLVGRIARDSGRSPSERKRRQTELRLWRGYDGLDRISGVLDPESGEIIRNALEREMLSLAHDPTRRVDDDDHGAADPSGDGGHDERARRLDDHLRVEALRECLLRAFQPGATTARPLIGIMIDVDPPGATGDDAPGRGTRRPTTETFRGEPVPPETLQRLWCGADLAGIVFNGPTSPIQLGRTARLPSPEQRMLLRAWHTTCSFPDCDRPFDWCQIHHVLPWQQGGPTDPENLTPLCSRHHHLVHEGGWRIELLADRRVKAFTPKGRYWGASDPDGPRLRSSPGRSARLTRAGARSSRRRARPGRPEPVAVG